MLTTLRSLFMVKTFDAKIDWWWPALMTVGVAGCFAGPMMEGCIAAGLILGFGMLAMDILFLAGIKYQIKDGQIGVSNMFCWRWYPVGKIAQVKLTDKPLNGAAFSSELIVITFTDRSVMKSSSPLQIAPKDREGFIAALKEINPAIVVEA